MEPPLTLTVPLLAPHTLLPTSHSTFDPSPLPSSPLPPWSPPSSWTPSPTHNYPSPYGTMSLGGLFRTKFVLTNRTEGGVEGVKMMLEVQGPGGRYRLGEVIHGQAAGHPSTSTAAADPPERTTPTASPPDEKTGLEPASEPAVGDPLHPEGQTQEPEHSSEVESFSQLPPGESTSLEVEAEMKELGTQVLICSVAWETPEGRRTFQRFLKFNVNPPLSIKTRIHTPLSPVDLLDPTRRGEVHLEVLMQNTSTEGLVFDRVLLEPVHGLTARRVSSTTSATGDPAVENEAFKGPLTTLLPHDSRQYLFLLSPSPPVGSDDDISVFPPTFPGGTVLPLGRLDVAWRSGRYHDPGRLQTSTLNRRVPVTPIAPKRVPTPTPVPAPAPTRTTSAAAPAPAGLSSPTLSPPPLTSPPPIPIKDNPPRWEFDLSILTLVRDGVGVDEEVQAKLRLGVRRAIVSKSDGIAPNTDEVPPEQPDEIYLAIQHLAIPPLAPSDPPQSPQVGGAPQTTLSPPSRGSTPQPPSTRPFSPGTSSSRPLTPIMSQLQAAAASPHFISHFATLFPPPPSAPVAIFPPSPLLVPPPSSTPPSAPPLASARGRGQDQREGEAYPLGTSMSVLPPAEWKFVREQSETTYSDSPTGDGSGKTWEAVYEFPLSWLALSPGLAPLGGLRALVLDDPSGLRGYVGEQWDSLGDIYIT